MRRRLPPSKTSLPNKKKRKTSLSLLQKMRKSKKKRNKSKSQSQSKKRNPDRRKSQLLLKYRLSTKFGMYTATAISALAKLSSVHLIQAVKSST
jgi:hypothetical protein